MIVVFVACDGPAPPPEAVATLVMETAPASVCEMVYVAVQETVAFGARVKFASPQLNGAVLMRLSFILNWSGPRLVLPIFLMT